MHDNTYAEAVKILAGVSTATITTLFLKQGLRNVWMRGTAPLQATGRRVAGPVFTMRFIPAREDLATPAAWSSPTSTRHAVEAVPEGAVVVVDAMGTEDAGIFGDILCARLRKRGVAGLVTDGVLRDRVGVLDAGLPVWARGVAAPPAVCALTFAGWEDPIACGGVAIFPGDWIVADDDGAVVIPAAQLEYVLAEGLEQERLETWIMHEVEEGRALPGLYPPDDDTQKRYQEWAARKP